MDVNNLPKVAAAAPGRESNPRSLDPKSDALGGPTRCTTTSPGKDLVYSHEQNIAAASADHLRPTLLRSPGSVYHILHKAERAGQYDYYGIGRVHGRCIINYRSTLLNSELGFSNSDPVAQHRIC